jgi:MFS family permease
MSDAPADGAPKVPFLTQLKSFGAVYWIANWMELVERFAYYGVRVVLPVFMVAAFQDGGPEFDHDQKGKIFSTWALVQSFVPIFTGGFADRYGYKVNIAISTVLKIIGYLVMGYCIFLAERIAGMPLVEARPVGADRTYEIFYVGAMFLATGTAIFKPGVQGLIANQMPRESSSLGWGLFYQMVNIGGFIGPLLAGYLRVLEWEYVFLACAAGIALNFVPLFFFAEPPHHGEPDTATPLVLIGRAVRGLLEPRLFFFTIAFAGFWLMFYQLFDILPNFIDDWVDSRDTANMLIGMFGNGAVPTINGGNLTQEWIINFNALLISLFAFAMGYLTGKVRSLTAIIVGIGPRDEHERVVDPDGRRRVLARRDEREPHQDALPRVHRASGQRRALHGLRQHDGGDRLVHRLHRRRRVVPRAWRQDRARAPLSRRGARDRPGGRRGRQQG